MDIDHVNSMFIHQIKEREIYRYIATYTIRSKQIQKQKPFWLSFVGIIAAEDGDPVVQKEQNEEQEECDADGWPANPVDGVGFAGGEDGGDEWAAIGGEELDGEEEDDGEEEETHRAKELGDGFGDGFALVTKKERDNHNNGYHYC